MSVTRVLKCCEEAVATRWTCRGVSFLEIRFFLADYFSVDGYRVYVHPLYAVACDVAGFNPDSTSSGHIRTVAGLLNISEELAQLVFDAANGEEPIRMDERSRVMEVRMELVERIAKQQKESLHTWWGDLKARS